jgi:hypothetical protein
MADIVSSIFGFSPEQIKQQQLESDRRFAQDFAATQATPYAREQAMLGATVGSALTIGIAGLLGIQDPQLARASEMESILQQVNNSLTPEEKANPANLYGRLSETLAQNPKFQREALMAQQQAQSLGLEFESKQATIAKTRQEALLKQQDYLREEGGRAALQKLQEVKAAQGLTPTTEEVISVLGPYMSADKLAGMMQTSADKEAYRKTMLDQAQLSLEGRLEGLRMQGATQLQIKQMEIQGRKEIEALKASLNPSGGSKSSVYERGYANNFVTSAKELVPATTNLNILTNGGTSPVTAGVFTNLQNKGILSATGAVLGTAMTSSESGQYESIMLPVIGNIATMQNAGRRYTTAQTDRLEKALIAKPGQPYVVQVQKMGELRQIAEAAAEAAQVNPAMSDEQKAEISATMERVRQAIPFTGADVAKFSGFSKKNPTVKFVDWLKVNGSDKEAFGTAPLPEKVIGGVTYVNDGKGWKKK